MKPEKPEAQSIKDKTKNESPYNVEAPKTLNEQRDEFINKELKNAQELIAMQKFSSEEQKRAAIEKLKSGMGNFFDSWATNIKAGFTLDDIKFLDAAENPYNYMGMSTGEKMRLYDLQERKQIAKEQVEQEKSQKTSKGNEWYVGAEKNSDGSLDLSKAAIFKPQEKPQEQSKESKEKLEGEKLFEYQIENNSHVSAKNLKEDLAMFIKTVDGGYMRTHFQDTKEELSEILYRNGIEYEKNKEIKINGKDKEILQPILDFRKELDEWRTLTELKIDNFRENIVSYLQDTFGVEVQEPREGEKYDSKTMRAMKTEETKNEFLDYKIKKVSSPGYYINAKLFDYYKKWLTDKRQEISNKHKSLKNTVSQQEFDKITDQDQNWLKQHSFTNSIQPAQVEIYRFKA